MHAMKVQTDTHTKLVDRLASNDELMAYIQSPVGQRFLTNAPVAIDAGRPNVAAPYSRILTSIQIGVVATCGGTGLWIAKSRVIEEVAQPLHVVAVLAIALGIGFVISALLSYGLSERMGLMTRSTNA
jgi:dihydrodipicolinate reductase